MKKIFFLILVISSFWSCKNHQEIKTNNSNSDKYTKFWLFDSDTTFYENYKGIYNNENISVSILYSSSKVTGYLIFENTKKYYKLIGNLDNDSLLYFNAFYNDELLSFTVKFFNINQILVSFFPFKKEEILNLETNYKVSRKINVYKIDTNFTKKTDEFSINYEINLQYLLPLSKSESDDSIINKFWFFTNNKKEKIFDGIIEERLNYFNDVEIFNEIDWYEYEFQDIILNEKDILIISYITSNYSGGVNFYSDENYLIVDFKTGKQYKFEDIFDENKSTEINTLFAKKMGFFPEEFEYCEPIVYFTNSYFYITTTTHNAINAGNFEAFIDFSELEDFFTTDFKQNILSRFR